MNGNIFGGGFTFSILKYFVAVPATKANPIYAKCTRCTEVYLALGTSKTLNSLHYCSVYQVYQP